MSAHESYLEPYIHLDPKQVLEIPQGGVDGIIALTYSARMETDGTVAMSSLSEAVADATASIAQVHADSPVIIAGECTFSDGPPTAELMADFIVGQGVASTRLYLLPRPGSHERQLNNTPRQIQALEPEMAARYEGGRFVAVAFGYHEPRILDHAKAHQLPPLATTNVDGVLEAAGKIDDYPWIDEIDQLAKHEQMVRAINKLSPGGTILNLLTDIQGPQLHDVVLDHRTGEYREVIDSVKSNPVLKLAHWIMSARRSGQWATKSQ